MIEAPPSTPGLRDGTRQATAARALLPWVRPGCTVLEIGCGPGWSTLLLAAAAGSRGTVLTWDPDPEARTAARAATAHVGFEQRVRVLDHLAAAPAPAIAAAHLVHLGPHCDIATARAELPGLHAVPWLSVAVPPGQVAAALHALHAEQRIPLLATTGAPVVHPDDVPAAAHDTVLVGQRVADRIGFAVDLLADQRAFQHRYQLAAPGRLLEPDLDHAENDGERRGRKRRDAEVLCALAASFPGPCLDLGTSLGRSAYKIATNIGPAHTVTTVNMLPEHTTGAGDQITHVLTREQIGAYCREHGVANVRQVYANTRTWDWAECPRGLHVAFLDACHDADAVLQDSLHAWERLAPGGFLVWHDFSPALASVHPWIGSVVQGVAAFLQRVRPRGTVSHLLGSWCGVLQRQPEDTAP